MEVVDTSHDDVVITRHDNGWTTAVKPGGFRSALMASIDDNGKITYRHIAAEGR